MPNEVEATRSELIEFCRNPELINYVCLSQRPGFYSWAVELEYTRFKPDTFANDGFHLAFSKWPEEDPIPSLTMAIVSIDKSGQAFAEGILWKHGLRKCKAGYVAVAFDRLGKHEFFIQGPNAFYLENHSKGAVNVAYLNDPKKTEAAWEHEKALANKFMDEHQAWIDTPEGKAV